MLRTSHEAVLGVLAESGVVARAEAEWQTTRRWQAAMMRAASKLVTSAPGDEDLRVPVAMALLELLGDDVADEVLAEFVEALLPLEARALPARI